MAGKKPSWDYYIISYIIDYVLVKTHNSKRTSPKNRYIIKISSVRI